MIITWEESDIKEGVLLRADFGDKGDRMYSIHCNEEDTEYFILVSTSSHEFVGPFDSRAELTQYLTDFEARLD